MPQPFEIVANAAATGPIGPIDGMGILLDPGQVHLVETDEEIEDARDSDGALGIPALCLDNAYGPGSHSLQLRSLPGSVPVLPADVDNFLDKVQLESSTQADFELFDLDEILVDDIACTILIDDVLGTVMADR